MVAAGRALIVILVVAVLLHPPLVKLYVIVYVPGVLATRSISPVAALITTPAGAVYVPPAVPVCVTVAVPVAQYGLPLYAIVATGNAVIVIEAVVVLLHAPAVKLYVIVYVPGVLATRSISPVAALITTPAGAVYVPPAVPVCVTVAVPVAQYGLPLYAIVATGNAAIVIEAVVILLHAPAVKLYVIVYVPGVLATRSISPVTALITTPAGAVYVPPAVPVWVTVAVPVAQYGLPLYAIVATGNAVIVIEAVAVLLHAPAVNE